MFAKVQAETRAICVNLSMPDESLLFNKDDNIYWTKYVENLERISTKKMHFLMMEHGLSIVSCEGKIAIPKEKVPNNSIMETHLVKKNSIPKNEFDSCIWMLRKTSSSLA